VGVREEEGATDFPNPRFQALGFGSYNIAILSTSKRKKITDTANAFFFQNQRKNSFRGGGKKGVIQ